VLTASLAALRQRVDDLRADAFRRGMPQIIGALEHAERDLGDVGRDLGAAHGGNDDAAQRARRKPKSSNPTSSVPCTTPPRLEAVGA